MDVPSNPSLSGRFYACGNTPPINSRRPRSSNGPDPTQSLTEEASVAPNGPNRRPVAVRLYGETRMNNAYLKKVMSKHKETL